MCPASGEYVLGAPYFDRIVVKLPGGKQLRIEASGTEKGERYVDDLRFNGEEYRLNYLRRADLLKGGLLQFNMSDQPNLKRGSTDESSPYSFSRASVSSAK